MKVSASQRFPFSVLALNPYKGPARKISYETRKRREKASSQGSQKKKAVNGSRRKAMDREGWLLSEELGPVDSEAGSASARECQRSWWLCRNLARIHARDSQMQRKPHKSVTDFSLLALEENLNQCLFVFLFFHPLGSVCCVFVKQCEMPLTGYVRNHYRLDGHELI